MPELPPSCVIDTNVPMAAAGLAAAGPCCIIACGEALQDVKNNGHLFLDANDEILKEYIANIPWAGHPTPASAFLKWVIDNQYNPTRCTRVHITPTARENPGYEEFPAQEALQCIDHDDRKFIAVSAAHSDHPPILEATDSKWWGWKDALDQCGVTVIFLCEQEIAAKFRQKMGT